MATLPARVDLNGNVLHQELEVCDLDCLPFPHFHSETHGRTHDFCGWCLHWVATNGELLTRPMDNCHCEQQCHVLHEIYTQLG